MIGKWLVSSFLSALYLRHSLYVMGKHQDRVWGTFKGWISQTLTLRAKYIIEVSQKSPTPLTIAWLCWSLIFFHCNQWLHLLFISPHCSQNYWVSILNGKMLAHSFFPTVQKLYDVLVWSAEPLALIFYLIFEKGGHGFQDYAPQCDLEAIVNPPGWPDG